MAPKSTDKEATEAKPAEKKPEAPKLYSVTYLPAGTGPGTRHGAPEEMHVGLPNGGKKFMNANFPAELPAPTPDKPDAKRKSTVMDEGFPYAEAWLRDAEAKEWAAQYELQGLALKQISKSAYPKSPLHNDDEP